MICYYLVFVKCFQLNTLNQDWASFLQDDRSFAGTNGTERTMKTRPDEGLCVVPGERQFFHRNKQRGTNDKKTRNTSYIQLVFQVTKNKVESISTILMGPLPKFQLTLVGKIDFVRLKKCKINYCLNNDKSLVFVQINYFLINEKSQVFFQKKEYQSDEKLKVILLDATPHVNGVLLKIPRIFPLISLMKS